MTRIVKIERCSQCPDFRHSGEFSTPAYIPRCTNMGCVIPHKVDNGRAIPNEEIPGFCPLDFAPPKGVVLLKSAVPLVLEALEKLSEQRGKDLKDSLQAQAAKVFPPYELTESDHTFIECHGNHFGTHSAEEITATIKTYYDQSGPYENRIIDAYLLWLEAVAYGKG